jgi:hypothetical protein
MDTNERLEKALMQVAESHMNHFMESLHSVKEGDLKSLEEQVMNTITMRGWLMMETTLSAQTQEPRPPSQRAGAVDARCDWWECEANNCKC